MYRYPFRRWMNLLFNGMITWCRRRWRWGTQQQSDQQSTFWWGRRTEAMWCRSHRPPLQWRWPQRPPSVERSAMPPTLRNNEGVSGARFRWISIRVWRGELPFDTLSPISISMSSISASSNIQWKKNILVDDQLILILEAIPFAIFEILIDVLMNVFVIVMLLFATMRILTWIRSPYYLLIGVSHWECD